MSGMALFTDVFQSPESQFNNSIYPFQPTTSRNCSSPEDGFRLLVSSNYIDTKAKCRHLQKNLPVKALSGRCLFEFIDWRCSHSCWYFRPSFVNCCPSNLLSDKHSLFPPFLVWIQTVHLHTVYTYTVCKMTTFRIAFYESYLSTLLVILTEI